MRLAALILLLAAPASAAVPQTRMHAEYDVYAGGMRLAALEASYGIGEGGYSIAVAFRTTGLIGALFSGHQLSRSQGVWRGPDLEPMRVSGDGWWRGEPRRLAIDYENGDPVVRELTPPNEADREPVPVALQAHTIDSLSAMVLLVRRMAETGRCEADVTTFDGRRLVRVVARTAGTETLEATSRSSFAGPAARCDFEGRLLAGRRGEDDPAEARRPRHGSAWFAAAAPGAAAAPVRITFETKWFGDATMYLTRAAAQSATAQSAGALSADKSGNPK